MARENIQVKTPNFCLSPIDGSFCNINTENPTTVLDVKNKGGALITSFTFSFNIVGEIKALEYVGPARSYKFIDGLLFYTLEWVTSSKALIKLWEVDTTHMVLNLKDTFLLFDTGLYHFDVKYIDSVNDLYEGQRLFLGPSYDPDNLGEIQVVHIAAIDPIHNLITLTDILDYDFIKTDRISFHKNIYVISRGGIGSDTTKGTIFRLDPKTATIDDVMNSGVFKSVTVARWCEEFYSIAALCGMNLLYLNPYDNYRPIKSQMVNNYLPDKSEPYVINDVCFDGTDIYKLSNVATFRTDLGDFNLVSWDDFYNFQQDTLTPYAHNITNYSENSFTIGPYRTTTLNLVVRDQFNVALRDVNVKATIVPGDMGALLDPLSGQVTTDKDGRASLIYRSGAFFEGMTNVTYETNEGSNFTGSEWVWSNGYIRSYMSFPETGDELLTRLYQKQYYFGIYRTPIKQIHEVFKVPPLAHGGSSQYILPSTEIFGKNYFTMPGGDWAHRPNVPNEDRVSLWLPELINYNDDHPKCTFSVWDGNNLTEDFSLASTILLKKNEDHETSIISYDKYLVYNYDYTDEEGQKHYGMVPPPVWLVQKDIYHHMTFDQLKLSLHTNWVDGDPYDELFTRVNIDQFIFVEDAVPKFWSRKNPVDTDIWIRLRPFAHNLDANTVVMKLRELSYEGDTGYYDISADITMQYYDAGGGLLGIEIFYNPPEDFHNKAFVYVHIELYDTAPYPNKIYVNYWFVIIPDYKGPYLENLSPAAGETNVPIDTSISFDIKDRGTGVDIDTFDMTVNSRLVYPQEIIKVNKRHYKIKYTPATPFRYGEEVIVRVQCVDMAEQKNILRTSYPFYIDLGYDIDFIAEQPLRCEWGVPNFYDVRVLALGTGGGVDKSSLRMQVYGKDITDKSNILPIVYRVA